MEKTLFLILLWRAVDGDIGRHYFLSKNMNFTEAQSYCRQHYTDLSCVNSEQDTDKLLKAAGENFHKGWIGLQKEPNTGAWKWSGGGYVTYKNWRIGQPDDHKGKEDNGIFLPNGKWNDVNEAHSMHFFCISISVVDEEKTWEEALEHCREHHTDLPSLLSETELLLAQAGIQQGHFTERVWIGLRYLGDRWLWINGNPLEYEAWPQGGHQDHQCPIRKRCGALTKDKLWESWDCLDKLNFICI